MFGLLVASKSIGSAWALICYTNSFKLVVSSSSATTGVFWAAVGRLGSGIWFGSFKGESSGTSTACKAVNHPSLKVSFRASLMTGSIEFSTSAKPSSYYLLSQPSRAALMSANSFACSVFRFAASANFNSVSPSLASRSENLFSADIWPSQTWQPFSRRSQQFLLSPCL